MVDGEEIFRLKYQKMSEAKSSIYIANYDLDPNLRLLRGNTTPQSLEIHGLIASPCRSESSDYGGSLHHDDDGYDNTDCTMQNLLIQKAKQKVDIKILVWEPRPIVRMLPNSRKRGL
jgi:hypothetical protein